MLESLPNYTEQDIFEMTAALYKTSGKADTNICTPSEADFKFIDTNRKIQRYFNEVILNGWNFFRDNPLPFGFMAPSDPAVYDYHNEESSDDEILMNGNGSGSGFDDAEGEIRRTPPDEEDEATYKYYMSLEDNYDDKPFVLSPTPAYSSPPRYPRSPSPIQYVSARYEVRPPIPMRLSPDEDAASRFPESEQDEQTQTHSLTNSRQLSQEGEELQSASPEHPHFDVEYSPARSSPTEAEAANHIPYENTPDGSSQASNDPSASSPVSQTRINLRLYSVTFLPLHTNVWPHTKLWEIPFKFKAKKRLRPDIKVMVFQGENELDPKKTIEELGLEDGDVLRLVLRMRVAASLVRPA